MEILNNEDFLKKIESGLTIVDFFAQWCGPCKMFGPTFDSFEKEFGEQINFVKVDVDKVPEIAQNYSVSSMPTVIVFKDGLQIERQSGLMNPIQFRMFVNALLVK